MPEEEKRPGEGKLGIDQSPLPLNITSLPVPIEFEEVSSGCLVLKSRWFAPFCFVTAPPFSLFSFVLIGVVVLVAGVGLADFLLWKVLVREPALGMLFALVFLVGGLRTFVLVMIAWATMKWRRGGPVQFDRTRDRLVFGPECEQPPLLLSTIAAVQLIQATSLDIGGDVWKALTGDKPKLGFLFIWAARRGQIYQLNLVLTTGVRMNLVNWGRWGERQETLTRRLVEFLKVPLSGHRTTESELNSRI